MDYEQKVQMLTNHFATQLRNYWVQNGGVLQNTPTKDAKRQMQAYFEQMLERTIAAADPLADLYKQIKVDIDIDESDPSRLNITMSIPDTHPDLIHKLWIPEPSLLLTNGEVSSISFYEHLPEGERLRMLTDYFTSILETLTFEVLDSRWRPGWKILCDEDAKLKRLPINPTATFLLALPGQTIAGNACFYPEEMYPI